MIEFIIKYWLEFLFTGVCGAIGFVIKKMYKKQKAVELGVQALLRNALLQEYRKYKVLKEIPIIDKENIEHIYKQYHELKGNDIGTKMYEELIAMPTKIMDE